MEVPFLSSGAMSRSHYALVRKVETAQSSQAADSVLLHEIESIRGRLLHPRLPLKQCKEELILILYCAMTLMHASLGDLTFALPHAVHLAEVGQTVQDKRIGYLFCSEMMPPNHELQLMLVNTLRKDLESTHIPRVCLALDALIQSSTEDVIPAIQSRLHDLLSHNSIHVRRRALLAFRSLSRHDPEILSRIEGKALKRVKDPEPSVSHAALVLSTKLPNSCSAAVNNLLVSTWASGQSKSKRRTLLHILQALRVHKPSVNSGPIILEIIKDASDPPVRSLLREAFLVLSSIPAETLRRLQADRLVSPVASIRTLLTSNDPDDQYLFIFCVSCVDPSLWAGTLPNTVAVLEEWEVEQVMRLLNSPDGLIRKITLKVLRGVDPSIIGSYYSQMLQNIPPAMSARDKNEYVSRLLEIGEMQSEDDCEVYATHLKDLFATVEGESQGRPEDMPVLENSIERILVCIRELEISSRIACVTMLIVPVTEVDVRIGPTLMVVVAAMACEYCGKISVSPPDVLRGMAGRLSSYAATVQDACLLSMLRVSAECNEVSPDVVDLVTKLSQFSGRHIRRRCEQFITVSSQRRVLADLVSHAPSSTLPDFLAALTNYQSGIAGGSSQPGSPRVSHTTSPALSPPRSAASPSKLRYDAYASPQPVPSLRHLTSPRNRPSSSRSMISSPGSRSRSLSQASDGRPSLDELTRTVTPGELTLAAAHGSLAGISEGSAMVGDSSETKDLASRVDLITLDSPFLADPDAPPHAEPVFEDAWDAMERSNLRGWCEASMDSIVRLLQGLQHRLVVIAVDQPPFEGELKVLVQGDSDRSAALRLRESDEESCLWRLRCEDMELRTTIKRLLEGI
ncbi:ARM repeat-containing protein [Leucogyrophana mollusca]|uniref:ARM repeat-containing protein n=1 Tax=Leucogyrophana mollusca TaxID=85980 RepID=A0ACB8BLN7_9AGAM|nr:ARM repeat-containing protein [Leucogyrophana mollusca]